MKVADLVTKAYNPAEARDRTGEWTAGGASHAAEKPATAPKQQQQAATKPTPVHASQREAEEDYHRIAASEKSAFDEAGKKLAKLFPDGKSDIFVNGRMKTLSSATRKMKDEGIDAAHLKDIVAYTVTAPDIESAKQAADLIRRNFKVVREKFDLDKTDPGNQSEGNGGYRAKHLNIDIGDGRWG